MIAITEEFKTAIVEAINEDPVFGVQLFEAIWRSAGDRIVTRTYFDSALAHLAKEFDQKLEQQSAQFKQQLEQQSAQFKQQLEQQSSHFKQQLLELRKELSNEFDVKLNRLEQRVDEKLTRQTNELKNYMDGKFGQIGIRWGKTAEKTFLRFAQDVIAQWGGTAKKWQYKRRITDEDGIVRELDYEVDIVLANGKIMLVEVKSHCDSKDIQRYLENAQEYERVEKPDQPIEKVIVTFAIESPVRKRAEKHGIRIITP